MEQLERARQEVLNYLEKNLNLLSKDQEKLIEEIIAHLTAKNYVIDKKLIKMVHKIIEENYRFIETFLKNLTLEKLPLPREVDNNAFRQKLLDRLFNFLYPDGLNLSERL
jgi:polyhydroxyalkanoate synthesis regulator protein